MGSIGSMWVSLNGGTCICLYKFQAPDLSSSRFVRTKSRSWSIQIRVSANGYNGKSASSHLHWTCLLPVRLTHSEPLHQNGSPFSDLSRSSIYPYEVCTAFCANIFVTWSPINCQHSFADLIHPLHFFCAFGLKISCLLLLFVMVPRLSDWLWMFCPCAPTSACRFCYALVILVCIVDRIYYFSWWFWLWACSINLSRWPGQLGPIWPVTMSLFWVGRRCPPHSPEYSQLCTHVKNWWLSSPGEARPTWRRFISEGQCTSHRSCRPDCAGPNVHVNEGDCTLMSFNAIKCNQVCFNGDRLRSMKVSEI